VRLGLFWVLLVVACTPIPPRSAAPAATRSQAPPPSNDSFVVDVDADGVSIGGSAIPLEGLESTVRANRGARLVVLRGGPTLAWERVVGVLDALHVLVADRFALELAQKSADRVELSLPKADPASASSRRLVVIAINAAGRASVDGMSVEDDAAARRLVASRMQEGAILVVQADRSAPFERVLSVVRAVHELGPLTFGVATLAPQ